MSLLRVDGLKVDYLTPEGPLRAVDDISFELQRDEILGFVGESGCGKSTAAMAAMRILGPPALISGGQVLFEDRDVLRMQSEELRQWHWEKIAIVMQSALNALNPVLTMKEHFLDTIASHRPEMKWGDMIARAEKLLKMVDIDPRHLNSYPHELSGGMRQRVVIALALTLEPPLLVMDEPTTALDVVVEREILKRVLQLQQEMGFAILFITHDLSLLLELATRLGVLYAGRLVELGPVEIFRRGGTHPYTEGLLEAVPQLHGGRAAFKSIPGSPPSLKNPPAGCRFHPRCPIAKEPCRTKVPDLKTAGPQHEVACHYRP
ncbi:MAG: ABC transporter ATP-binding protein [Deltaproteobacteria bacterium]|jgi:peptide/nickel transport system ATP-binding protein|nr:ABC transporter ATP-binding protein [Deltaproteobacteria bacterium]